MLGVNSRQLLDFSEEDTYITPPLWWWQHWWVWLTGIILLSLCVWALAHRYEKLRNLRNLMRLQQENQERQQRIETIRQKAMEADEGHQESSALAKEIVKMAGQPKHYLS